MKDCRVNDERPQRRFCEAKDGPAVRRLYASMRTAANIVINKANIF